MVYGLEYIINCVEVFNYPYYPQDNGIIIPLVDRNGRPFNVAITVIDGYYVELVTDYLLVSQVARFPQLSGIIFEVRQTSVPFAKYGLTHSTASNYIVLAEMDLSYQLKKDSTRLLNRLFAIEDLASHYEEDKNLCEDAAAI